MVGNHEALDGDNFHRYDNMTWGETLGQGASTSTATSALGHLLTKGLYLAPAAHGSAPSGTSRYYSVDIGTCTLPAPRARFVSFCSAARTRIRARTPVRPRPRAPVHTHARPRARGRKHRGIDSAHGMQTAGLMHVVGLDLTPSSLDEAQLAWLEQDLAAANRNREQVWIKIKTAALRLAESVLACAVGPTT